MAITAIVLAMFSNILVNSIRTSVKLSARSSLREELSVVGSLIRRDIRNATEIINCADTTEPASLTACRLYNDSDFIWQACSDDSSRLCKQATTGEDLYRTSTNFNLDSISFEPGFETTSGELQRNVLITIVASHTNENLGAQNLIYQTSVSTRNYSVIDILQ